MPIAEPARETDTSLSQHHRNVVDPLLRPAKGYVELSYAAFFCVYIPRNVLDDCGLLDVENGPHYRSDRLYCDVVRNFAHRKIVYTPHSKVYHFHMRATDTLREKDRALFDKMYVKNDWMEIIGQQT